MVNKQVKVLMVGSNLNVKGGMTTVVESFLNHHFKNNIFIKYIPTHIENVGTIEKTLYFLISLLRICFEFVIGQVDIVHMHMSERGSFKRKYYIFKIAKFFHKPVITHTHGAEFELFYRESNSRLKNKIKILLKDSDVVITLGKKWDQIIKHIEPNVNTTILRNSVQIPVLPNVINTERIKVLFLAVLIKRKGIIDLIEASKVIIEEIEKNNKYIEFIIAGDGELIDDSKSLVNNLGLKSYYTFVGWVNSEKKHQLLKKTDLFILPSYNEGLPLSILEAISYGIPIISTDVGSINEAVENGKNGFLVEPGNLDQLADQTTKLVLENNISEMGTNSRIIAEERFNIQSYFNNITNLYLMLSQIK